jgi:hypothetical protein
VEDLSLEDQVSDSEDDKNNDNLNNPKRMKLIRKKTKKLVNILFICTCK